MSALLLLFSGRDTGSSSCSTSTICFECPKSRHSVLHSPARTHSSQQALHSSTNLNEITYIRIKSRPKNQLRL
ncbi:hypothetical protein M3J09_012984 [Ascochyta lentis]